mmetsp:Transcript_23194/g.54723  ORF Transcript_23194/g.54723 Transcript_23194/m.54723 type:complete len:208 (+) Transcript_23194:604-1227(+)
MGLGSLARSRVSGSDDNCLAATWLDHRVHVNLRPRVCSHLFDGRTGGAYDLAHQMSGDDDRLVDIALAGSWSCGIHRHQRLSGSRWLAASLPGSTKATHVVHHVVEVLVHLCLLLCHGLPVHVLALVDLCGLLTIRRNVALVTTDGTGHIRHLVILVVGLGTLEAQMTQSTANATSLLCLVQGEAIDHGQLLHAVGSRILELRTFRV